MKVLRAVALTILLGSTSAFACSCSVLSGGWKKNAEFNFKDSAAVLLVVPTEVTPVPETVKGWDGKERDLQTYRVKLAVKETFKGTVSSNEVTSNTGSGGGDCSYGAMKVGVPYLIYASAVSDSEIKFYLCSGSAPLNADASDLRGYAQLFDYLRKLSRQLKKQQGSHK